MLPVVAVDLGGTNLRAAFFPTGQPPAERTLRVATPAAEGVEAVLLAIAASVRELARDPLPKKLRLAVAAPGPLDSFSGVVFHAPNLPGWINVPLRARLEQLLGCHVRVGNDANLAALGEWRYGAGKGVDNLLYLTISTGIGGGVIAGGKLLTGFRGLASEPGHLPLLPGGPVCSCGKVGHLEALASGTAIARRTKELLAAGETSTLRGEPDSESVARAANQGDALATRVLVEAGQMLGRGLAGLVHLFNPERIVLGGGVIRAGEVFLQPTRLALQAEVMDPAFLQDVDLVEADLGDDSGMMGALVLATTE
jgi:glucokinase